MYKIFCFLIALIFAVIPGKGLHAAETRVPLGASITKNNFECNLKDQASGYYYTGMSLAMKKNQALILEINETTFPFMIRVLDEKQTVLSSQTFALNDKKRASGSLSFLVPQDGNYNIFIIQSEGQNGSGRYTATYLDTSQITKNPSYTFQERFNFFYDQLLAKFAAIPLIGQKKGQSGYDIDFGMLDGSSSTCFLNFLQNKIYQSTDRASAEKKYQELLPRFKDCADSRYFDWVESGEQELVVYRRYLKKAVINQKKAQGDYSSFGDLTQAKLLLYEEDGKYTVSFEFSY